MGSRLVPWRTWRYELEGLFRDAGFSDQAIRKMDWGALRDSWAEGYSARETFDDEIAAGI